MVRDVGHAIFEWKVTNISFFGNIPAEIGNRIGTDNAIESSCFSTPVASGGREYLWSLLLKVSQSRDFVKVCLKRKLTKNYFIPEFDDGVSEDMFCRAKFYCTNQRGDTLLKESHDFKIQKKGAFEVEKVITLNDICEKDSDGLFISDFLTVKCKLWFWRCEEREDYEETISLNSFQFSKELAELYKLKKFTDVQVEARDGILDAHKAILACRSGYFSKILAEDNNNCIKILSTSLLVIGKIIEFLYTGNVNSLLDQSLPIDELEECLGFLKIRGIKWMTNPVVFRSETEVFVEEVVLKVTFNDMGFQCSTKLESSACNLNCKPYKDSRQGNFVELSMDFKNFFRPFPFLWQISALKGQKQLCKSTEVWETINHRGKFSFKQSINKNSFFGGPSCYPTGLSTLHSRLRYTTGEFFSTVTIDEESKASHSVSSSDGDLSSDLNSLCFLETFSDVTLICRDKEFRAHKAILAARSGKFSSIFDEVKAIKRIMIQDVKPCALVELLRYIYTGKNGTCDLHAVCKDYSVYHIDADDKKL